MRLGQSDYLRQVRLFSRNARLYLLSSLAYGLSYGIYSLLFNIYLVSLGYREDFIGQVVGLSALVTGIASIPAGVIADRMGRRWSTLVGTMVGIAGSLGQILFLQPEGILLSAVVAGAGVSLAFIAANPFLAENSTPAQRDHLFSTNFAIVTLASVLGNLVGGSLPGLLGGSAAPDASAYRWALLVASSLYIVSALPIYCIREQPWREKQRLPKTEEAAGEAEAGGEQEVGARRRILSFVAVNVLLGTGAGLIIPFFNVYFVKEMLLPAATVGLIFAASQALIGVSALFTPLLSRRAGKVYVVGAGQLSGVPFLLLLAVAGQPQLAVPAFLARSVGINMVNPISSAFTMEMVPVRLRGAVSGLLSTAWNTCWAASSAAGGLLILSLGYSRVFVLAALFYSLAGATFLASFWRYRQR